MSKLSVIEAGPIRIQVFNNRLVVSITGKRDAPETEKAFVQLAELIKTADCSDLKIDVMKCKTRDGQGREPDAINLYLVTKS